MISSKKKYLWFVIFSLTALNGFALPPEKIKLIDQGNQAFLAKDYSGAVKYYADFMKGIEEKKLSAFDKKFYDETKGSRRDAEILAAGQEIVQSFPKLKDMNEKGAAQAWMKIMGAYQKMKIDPIPYLDVILSGNIEPFLLEKKEKYRGIDLYQYYLKLDNDRKRVKKVAFIQFKKDKGFDTDLEEMLKNSLNSALENQKRFSLIRNKKYSSISAIKADNVDFAVMGEYKRIEKNKFEMKFSIMDAQNDKELINVVLTSAMDLTFFGMIDQIAQDFEKNLKEYSRLEDFSPIHYSKSETGKLVKSEIKEEFKDFNQWVRENYDISKQRYLDWVKKENNLAAVSSYTLYLIDSVNLKLDQPSLLRKYFDEQLPLLKKVMIQDTKLTKYISGLENAKTEQDYEDYVEIYEKSQKFLEKDLKPEYKHMNEVIAVIEKEMKEDKAKTDKEAPAWPMPFKRLRHHFSLFVGSGALVGLGYHMEWLCIELGARAGYAFYEEHKIMRKVAPFGVRLGYNSKWLMKDLFIDPHAYVFVEYLYGYGIENYKSTNFLLIGGGIRFLKYYFIEGGYMLQKNRHPEIQDSVNAPFFGLGFKYRL